MTPDKRRAPPGGSGATSEEIVCIANADTLKIQRRTLKNQASRRRARFARSAVFEEFRYKHARALDYDTFTDRLPSKPARRANPEARCIP